MDEYSYWDDNSKDLFDDIQNNFSVESVQSFLQSIWLGESLTVFYEGELPKAVYMYGNLDEVYTEKEREFIEKIKNVIVFSGFTKKLRGNNITCRIVTVDMCWSTNPLHDGIQFMKIFYKAFRNFNIFVFVVDEKIYLGCNLLGKMKDDCFISFPLQDAMDWEAFADSMMYIDNTAFVPFYHDLLEAIVSIKWFYTEENDDMWDDDSYSESRINYKRLIQGGKDYDVIEFENEVAACKESLSYIKSNAVNPLELLYEAEMMEKTVQNTVEKFENGNYEKRMDQESEDVIDDSMIELLEDPEALIGMLKNRK